MGLIAHTGSANGTYVTQNQVSGTTVSVTLPNEVADGDDVYVALMVGSFPSGNTITPPTGYALVGAAEDGPTTGTSNGMFALYHHQYTSGDPTSVDFTLSLYAYSAVITWLIRGEDTPVLRTDSYARQTSAGTTFTQPNFNPTYPDASLRIAIIVTSYASDITPIDLSAPNTEAPLGLNQSDRLHGLWQQAASAYSYPSYAPNIYMWECVTPDSGGWDGGSTTWGLSGGVDVYARSLTFDDGNYAGVSGYSDTHEPIAHNADVDPTAWEVGAQAASAGGWGEYGGGAGIL